MPKQTIELHVIQTYAAARLNRNRDGSNKSLQYGGSRRLRVSSQAQKRAERDAGQDTGLPGAARTKVPHELVLRQLGEDAATPGVHGVVLAACAALFGDYDDTGRLKTQALLGEDEAARLAGALRPRLLELARLQPEVAGAEPDGAEPEADEAPVKGKGRGKKASPLAAAVAEVLAPFQAGTSSLDIGLYGRFQAQDEGWNVEAAASYGHAIGVAAQAGEIDFFSAVDDVTGDVAHLGESDLSAGTVYRFAALDLGQLARNLGAVQVAGAARSWAWRNLTSTPGGGGHGAYSQTLPEYVLVIVRSGGHPITLAPAFEAALRRGEAASLAPQAVQALEAHLAGLRRMYGGHGEVLAVSASVQALDAGGPVTRAESVQAALDRALGALGVA